MFGKKFINTFFILLFVILISIEAVFRPNQPNSKKNKKIITQKRKNSTPYPPFPSFPIFPYWQGQNGSQRSQSNSNYPPRDYFIPICPLYPPNGNYSQVYPLCPPYSSIGQGSNQSMPTINNVNHIVIQIQQDKADPASAVSDAQKKEDLANHQLSNDQLQKLQQVQNNQTVEVKRLKILSNSVKQQKLEMRQILIRIRSLNMNSKLNYDQRFSNISDWCNYEKREVTKKWQQVINLSGGELVIDTLSFIRALSNIVKELNKNKKIDSEMKWGIMQKYIQLVDEKSAIPWKSNSLCHIDTNLSAILNLTKNKDKVQVIAKPNTQTSAQQQQLTPEEQDAVELQQKWEFQLLDKELDSLQLNEEMSIAQKYNAFTQWVNTHKLECTSKWEAMSSAIKSMNLSNNLSFIVSLASIILELNGNNKLNEDIKWKIIKKWITSVNKIALSDWPKKHYSLVETNLAVFPEITFYLQSK